MKNASVVLGLLALVAASAAVYVTFDAGSIIQGKPEQTKASNYSAEIGTLGPQISSLSNNISSLGTLKSDISDIKGKLSDLETRINRSQQVTVSANPTIAFGATIYLPGDIVRITAEGLDPQKVVDIQLLDNYGEIVMQQEASANSAGRLTYYLQLPSTLMPGNFQVKLVSGQQTVSQPIKITAYPSQNSGSVSLAGLSYLFNSQTDKIVYRAGDIIEVFGIGAPNTNVYAVLSSPSGKTYTSNTTVQPDGTYAMFFSTSQFFEKGNWSVTVNNQGLTRILYLTIIESGNSSLSSTSTFTAQTYKAFYIKGESIQVSGIAKPYTTVKADFTSPSQTTFHIATTTAFDGSYAISFPTSPSSETGNWLITLTNWQVSKVVSIYLEP